jgi:hypothetical protein
MVLSTPVGGSPTQIASTKANASIASTKAKAKAVIDDPVRSRYNSSRLPLLFLFTTVASIRTSHADRREGAAFRQPGVFSFIPRVLHERL